MIFIVKLEWGEGSLTLGYVSGLDRVEATQKLGLKADDQDFPESYSLPLTIGICCVTLTEVAEISLPGELARLAEKAHDECARHEELL